MSSTLSMYQLVHRPPPSLLATPQFRPPWVATLYEGSPYPAPMQYTVALDTHAPYGAVRPLPLPDPKVDMQITSQTRVIDCPCTLPNARLLLNARVNAGSNAGTGSARATLSAPPPPPPPPRPRIASAKLPSHPLPSRIKRVHTACERALRSVQARIRLPSVLVHKPLLSELANKPQSSVLGSKPQPKTLVDKPQPRTLVKKPQPSAPVDKLQPSTLVGKPQPNTLVDKPQPSTPMDKPQSSAPVNKPQPSATARKSKRRPSKRKLRSHSRMKTLPKIEPSIALFVSQTKSTSAPSFELNAKDGARGVKLSRDTKGALQACLQVPLRNTHLSTTLKSAVPLKKGSKARSRSVSLTAKTKIGATNVMLSTGSSDGPRVKAEIRKMSVTADRAGMSAAIHGFRFAMRKHVPSISAPFRYGTAQISGKKVSITSTKVFGPWQVGGTVSSRPCANVAYTKDELSIVANLGASEFALSAKFDTSGSRRRRALASVRLPREGAWTAALRFGWFF